MKIRHSMQLAATPLALLALLGSEAPAQVKVGDKAPTVEAKQLLNTKIRSLTELKGRVVLYEFFAYW